AIPVPIIIPMIFSIINFFNIKVNNKNAIHKPII
ncbi:putative membrane protein, partial [Clostridioides difficile CD175]